jgi:peptidoglycan/LPS O-acetylase OafA/YrhL
MAFHLGFGWASGGFLGVDLFFVLSGFLITSLLIEERCFTDRIRLGAFWGRRARRLLPALFLVVLAIAVFVVIMGRTSAPSLGAAKSLSVLRGDALSTLFYFANWHTIFVSQLLSPLSHTWSLAIEEQFYLVWPIFIVILFKTCPRRWRRVGLGLCVVGALASATEMAVLIHPNNSGFDRIYYGTDTRAFALLAGAAVAMVAANRPQPGPKVRSLLHVVSPFAGLCVVVCWMTAAQHSGWLFRGGFLVYALLVAVVIADVRQFEPGRLARLLSFRSLCWIGTISYGLYLWHWPIIFYLNETRTGLSGVGLALTRVAVTFVVATASYYLVERPIRQRRFSAVGGGLLVAGGALVSIAVVVAGTTPTLAAPLRTWTGGGLDPGFGPNVPGAGGLSGEVPLAYPPGQGPSRSHPLRVMTIGDTVMTSAQLGIAAALQSTGEVSVVRYALPHWGLTNRSAQAFLRREVQAFHPQVVIGTWSSDIVTAKSDPTNYGTRLDAAIRTLLTPGDGVFGVIFLQMPALRSAGGSQATVGPAAWNDAVERSSSAFPGRVMYLPVGDSVERDGRFANWLPTRSGVSRSPKDWVRVRASDGVQLCPAGITRYTAPVVQDLTQLFHLSPPKPHWWESYAVTVQSLAYRDGGALDCPDDHPGRV